MKITTKILHLPPYISTTWLQIRALYMKGSDLVINLMDGVVISVPDLNPEVQTAIFSAYAAHLEAQTNRSSPSSPLHFIQSTPNTAPQSETEGPQLLRFSFDNLDSLNSAMHHNSAYANMPDLPKEVVNKIALIAKVVAPEEIQNIPKPEPHCNCMHCQIARAIHFKDSLEEQNEKQKPEEKQAVEEEVVTDDELSFQEWDIIQTGDKLFSVINRLDSKEKYSVYLGHPVGCTCGKQGCEHILAVLKS